MFSHSFEFSDAAHEYIAGTLTLDDATTGQSTTAFRYGRLALHDGRALTLVLTHSPATADFMYVRRSAPEPHLFELLGVAVTRLPAGDIWLPGQVTLGPARTQISGQAIRDTLRTPAVQEVVTQHTQDEIVILPVLREGAKYQVSEALYQNYGYYCDEALLDSHHVFDPSVPRYSRRVETTIVKDQDISPAQRQGKRVALIGDSIASGVVMLGVLALVEERFVNVTQLEIVAPFATLRGLARLLAYSAPRLQIRVHVFETILNALPPDYYYSAHYADPAFHFDPGLEEQYRAWWGEDAAGNAIADTACAGYGWAEAFFNPRKQIQMINEQLLARHHLTIGDIVRRNLQLG